MVAKIKISFFFPLVQICTWPRLPLIDRFSRLKSSQTAIKLSSWTLLSRSFSLVGILSDVSVLFHLHIHMTLKASYKSNSKNEFGGKKFKANKFFFGVTMKHAFKFNGHLWCETSTIWLKYGIYISFVLSFACANSAAKQRIFNLREGDYFQQDLTNVYVNCK